MLFLIIIQIQSVITGVQWFSITRKEQLLLRKRDIQIQSYKTDLYKRSVVNMGSKLYNKLPDYIKEIESYKTFRKELKSFLL